MAIVKGAGDLSSNVIGEKSYFCGSFIINGSLRIDGCFEGKNLKADQLYIGVDGKVKTNIEAVSVIVEGLIMGNINATSRVLLMPTAKVYGDIRTPELIIQNGVLLEGRCTIANDLRTSAGDVIKAEYEKNKINPDEIFKSSEKKIKREI
ncbi:MAG TPA: polymer-forming cytoskeletal protein [Spirochaetota bacterium]|nr:polymer-forming cytoskeletal protein [Spirochaetota bacterium]HOK93691.1 polymer-forming cytoskeletal protein [Spirochaetota bacterium]HON15397.1 polymer-forming cytoskeletal protein [Spirochaetota bacterium]HPD77811.1 polymer-forming cytoskeletal protein [Spirochaetota bacterium]HPP95980.1 polymer-forming cytoskeletal protein [Spirochaetota bacterium]